MFRKKHAKVVKKNDIRKSLLSFSGIRALEKSL